MLINAYQKELQQLEKFHQVCKIVISEHLVNQKFQLLESEKSQILEILDRIFLNELDFLEANAEDYFRIYH